GIEFRLDEDELADDDVRTLRVPVKAGVPVLVVDGQPSGGDPLSGAAGNVLLILDPLFNDVEAQDARRFFEPTYKPWYELGRGKPDFANFDAVILVNVRELEAEKVAPELAAYVDAGGGLFVFLGDQTRPEAWNERFYRADGSGLLPQRLAAEAKGEAYSPDVP